MTHTLSIIALLCSALAADTTPSPDTAAEAWSLARQWVNAGVVPSPETTPGPAIDGASVILRFDGKLIGADAAHRAQGDETPLHAAVRGAIIKALSDHRLSSLASHDEGMLDLRRTALANLAVEVEIAGPLQPLNGPTELLHQDIHPAHDGVVIRHEDQWTLHFPSRLYATGRAATSKLLFDTLLVYGVADVRADGSRRDGETTVYRMPAIALTQHAAGTVPSVRQRGREEVGLPLTNQAEVAALAHRLAGSLAQFGRLPDDAMQWWFIDGWSPSRDTWTEIEASTQDLALTAWALAAHARAFPNDVQATVSRTHAKAAIDAVSVRTDRDAAADASLMLAMLASNMTLPPDLVAQVQAAIDGAEPARSMAALALRRHGDVDAPAHATDRWLELNAVQLLETLPWSSLALKEKTSDSMQARLSQSRELLLAAQASDAHRWGPEASGAVLLKDDPSAIGLTALRAGWALAALIAAEDPQERVWLRDRALRLATHLKRRTISDATAEHWASPDRIRGCIRRAPWDERSTIAGQAMAVLTALELHDALQESSQQ
ncbi:MAG: hypothetical protein MK074_03880 [Phycisphaerales bacterium]|nr:hypothetical protein [Phycisphaerales bacterium]